MHRVEQIVKSALSAYENERLKAGAPVNPVARRIYVNKALESQLGPNEVVDRLIQLASAPKTAAPEPKKPAPKKQTKKEKADA